MGDQATIAGKCDPAFAAVRDEFAANFTARGELGAAVCVTVHGVVVADLHGGWAGPGQAWSADTLVNVFSVGKGLMAACAARLAGQGRLDPDALVTTYWPQFGVAGKQGITVRQLLSHQAGLPALRAPQPPGSMLEWARMIRALGEEQPWWEPGTGHGYHVNTFGFLAGELIRLVTGLTPGVYLRREVAGPLGADVHIGLAAADLRRVADFHWADGPPEGVLPSDGGRPGAGLRPRDGMPAPDGVPAPGQTPEGAAAQMTLNAYFNPPDFSGRGVVNSADWRTAEIPSANAHASAAGVARLYSALAAGGAIDGVEAVDRSALAAATEEQVYGDDLVLRRPSRFGLGFQLTHAERELGRGPRSFGHFGAGGSVGFCDPDAGIALGYVTNQMGPRWRNPRNRALIDACYNSL
jgi:CubicO group peptidase (beta-lactamase class C family)